MQEKTKKLFINICGAMIGFGGGLLLVSLFLDVVTGSVKTTNTDVAMGLFDDDVSALGLNPAFIIVSVITAVIGIVIFTVDMNFRTKSNKKIKGLNIAGLTIMSIGTVLVLVSGILFRNDVEDATVKMIIDMIEKQYQGQISAGTVMSNEIEILARTMMKINVGPTVYLGFIGGIVSIIGSVMFIVMQYKENKSVAPATETAPVGTENTVTEDTLSGTVSEQSVQNEATNNSIDPFDNN